MALLKRLPISLACFFLRDWLSYCDLVYVVDICRCENIQELLRNREILLTKALSQRQFLSLPEVDWLYSRLKILCKSGLRCRGNEFNSHTDDSWVNKVFSFVGMLRMTESKLRRYNKLEWTAAGAIISKHISIIKRFENLEKLKIVGGEIDNNLIIQLFRSKHKSCSIKLHAPSKLNITYAIADKSVLVDICDNTVIIELLSFLMLEILIINTGTAVTHETCAEMYDTALRTQSRSLRKLKIHACFHKTVSKMFHLTSFTTDRLLYPVDANIITELTQLQEFICHTWSYSTGTLRLGNVPPADLHMIESIVRDSQRFPITAVVLEMTANCIPKPIILLLLSTHHAVSGLKIMIVREDSISFLIRHMKRFLDRYALTTITILSKCREVSFSDVWGMVVSSASVHTIQAFHWKADQCSGYHLPLNYFRIYESEPVPLQLTEFVLQHSWTLKDEETLHQLDNVLSCLLTVPSLTSVLISSVIDSVRFNKHSEEGAMFPTLHISEYTCSSSLLQRIPYKWYECINITWNATADHRAETVLQVLQSQPRPYQLSVHGNVTSLLDLLSTLPIKATSLIQILSPTLSPTTLYNILHNWTQLQYIFSGYNFNIDVNENYFKCSIINTKQEKNSAYLLDVLAVITGCMPVYEVRLSMGGVGFENGQFPGLYGMLAAVKNTLSVIYITSQIWPGLLEFLHEELPQTLHTLKLGLTFMDQPKHSTTTGGSNVTTRISNSSSYKVTVVHMLRCMIQSRESLREVHLYSSGQLSKADFKDCERVRLKLLVY